MSYPKRHPNECSPNTRDLKKQQKKQQIKEILLSKFKNKYQISDAETENFLQTYLDQLLNEQQVSGAHINKLDLMLAQKLQKTNQTQESKLKSSSSVRSLRSSTLKSNAQNILKQGQISLKKAGSVTELDNYETPQKAKDEDAWNQIVKFNTIQFQLDKDKEKQNRIEKKQMLKYELEKQIFEKRQIKQREQKAEQDFLQYQRDLQMQEQKKQTIKSIDLQNKLQNEQKLRQFQLIANEIRKSQEADDQRKLEEQIRMRMEQELKEEKEKQHQKIMKFREQCNQQLEENKKLKEMNLQKETEMENKPPNGRDLMAQIYEEKKHISYQKREKNDKFLSYMQDKLIFAESMLRQKNEEKSIQNYIKKKNELDKKEEENRLRKIQDRENELKRILDIQLKERDDKVKLQKFEDKTEARNIKKDVSDFNNIQMKKKQDFDNLVKDHNSKLVQQIGHKKKGDEVDLKSLKMNKRLLEQIQESQLLK